MQGQAPHLLGGALAVVAGLGPVGHATAPPLGSADRSRPGAAGSLLPPRLGAAAADFGPLLGLVGSGPGPGQLGGDDLMEHRQVGLDSEYLGVELDLTRGGAVGAEQRGFDLGDGLRLLGFASRADRHQAFTASRTRINDPLAPGTAPLQHEQVALGVDPDDLEIQSRHLVVAHPTRHPGSLEDPGRSGAGTDRAGARCFLWVPWAAPWPAEAMAPHDALETLALGDSGHVGQAALGKDVGDLDLLAELVLSGSSTRISTRWRVGSTPALAKWPLIGSLTSLGLISPKAIWMAE